MRLPEVLQHARGDAVANDERLAHGGERGAELDQRIPDEGPVPAGGIGLAPETGLDDVERQDGTAARRGGQGIVVEMAQIAFEPDDLQGVGGVHGHMR